MTRKDPFDVFALLVYRILDIIYILCGITGFLWAVGGFLVAESCPVIWNCSSETQKILLVLSIYAGLLMFCFVPTWAATRFTFLRFANGSRIERGLCIAFLLVSFTVDDAIVLGFHAALPSVFSMVLVMASRLLFAAYGFFAILSSFTNERYEKLAILPTVQTESQSKVKSSQLN